MQINLFTCGLPSFNVDCLILLGIFALNVGFLKLPTVLGFLQNVKIVFIVLYQKLCIKVV